jgi:methylisocitrate lyase
MTANERRRTFKALLDSRKCIVVPGVYDAVSAKLVEEAGFPVAYVGSYACSASRLGQPDVGVSNLLDMVSLAQCIVDAIEIPVIADFEDGFSKPGNIWRSVREFERAGVVAVHIEDHMHGKHTEFQRVIRPLDQMVGRLKAALDARDDPNFMIIARTDAAWLSTVPAEAVERMNVFLETGADMVFPAGMKPEQLAQIRSQIKGRVVLTNSPRATIADEEESGANIVLYYGLCLYAAYWGVKTALRQFDAGRDFNSMRQISGVAGEFENLMGYKQFAERARSFGLV